MRLRSIRQSFCGGQETLALPRTTIFIQQRLLFRQSSSKFVLFLDYIPLVAIRIDEWVRAPLFQLGILCRQPEVISVGSEENIAGQ